MLAEQRRMSRWTTPATRLKTERAFTASKATTKKKKKTQLDPAPCIFSSRGDSDKPAPRRPPRRHAPQQLTAHQPQTRHLAAPSRHHFPTTRLLLALPAPTRLTHKSPRPHHTHTCTSSGHAERRTHKQLVRGPHFLEYCRITSKLLFVFSHVCISGQIRSGMELRNNCKTSKHKSSLLREVQNTSQSRLVICERSAGHVFAARNRTILLPWASQATWPSVRSHCAPHLNRVNCALSHRVCHTSCEEVCSSPVGRVWRQRQIASAMRDRKFWRRSLTEKRRPHSENGMLLKEW